MIECKHSTAKDYLIDGYREAMLYRHQYAPVLRGAVKGALVATGDVPGEVRSTDDVVAVARHQWPPREVIASILGMLRFAQADRRISMPPPRLTPACSP